jgi:mannose-6-phosphate isomerase-like protein (cupin superfamily)
VPDPGWRVVRLDDVPSPDELPVDDGVSEEEREAARAELRDDLNQPVFPDYPEFGSARWRAIRPYCGVTAFGVAATEAAGGEALLYPHTEAQYGHEEIYLVLEGRARFLFDGDGEVEVGRHELLFVRPEVGRGAIALETPTVLFMVGGKPGAYEPPIWARDWRPPEEWLAARRSAASETTSETSSER